MSEQVTLCAIVRDEEKYLLEWIAYHQAIGLEYFQIYNNCSTDNSLSLLQNLSQSDPKIQVINWPLMDCDKQVAAYSHFLKWTPTDWVLFLDIDEFLVLHQHNNIHDFLHEFSDYSGVVINWRMFGTSGLKKYDNRLVIERFTKCAPRRFPKNRNFKLLGKVKHIKQPRTPHFVFWKQGSKVCFPDKHPVKIWCSGPHVARYITHSVAQINHYVTKSVEEAKEKIDKGRATYPDGHVLNAKPHVLTLDNNKDEDLSIQKWIPQTKENIKTLAMSSAIDS